jgi:hypothetical protein
MICSEEIYSILMFQPSREREEERINWIRLERSQVSLKQFNYWNCGNDKKRGEKGEMASSND